MGYRWRQWVWIWLICLLGAGGSVVGATEVTVGVIYPLTGPAGATGQLLKKSVELAVDIVNQPHDLDLPFARTEGIPGLAGGKLKVIFADHQGNPETGRREAEMLVTKHKVNVLFGCYYSSVTATASEVAEKSKIPFLNAESTSPTLTERGFRWFFRTTPHDGLFALNFFQFMDDLKREKGIDIQRIGIFAENTLWGVDVTKAELRFAREHGYKNVTTVQYPAKSSNMDHEVTILKQARPQVLLQASYLADAVLSMQTYKKKNFAPQAILAMNAGFISPDFVKRLGPDANFILSREVWSHDIGEKKPMARKVADLFKERTRAPMDGNSARAFTGILVLADALNRAATLNAEAIRQAFLATFIPPTDLIMPWKGVMFDQETHQNILGQGIVVQIQDQAYHTIWPFDLATREVVWPFPGWQKR